MAPVNLQPFALAVPEPDLAELRRRVRATRWPDQLAAPANADWEYGTERGYLQALAGYWADGFDWRAAEVRFNAVAPQFKATVRGRRLRFLHQPLVVRGPAPGAPALLICHGWPGLVFEFHKVVGPLAVDFHVVAHSIPGFGFSEAASARGFNAPEAARDFHQLMLDLG
jgi:hypothetical protein